MLSKRKDGSKSSRRVKEFTLAGGCLFYNSSGPAYRHTVTIFTTNRLIVSPTSPKANFYDQGMTGALSTGFLQKTVTPPSPPATPVKEKRANSPVASPTKENKAITLPISGIFKPKTIVNEEKNPVSLKDFLKEKRQTLVKAFHRLAGQRFTIGSELFQKQDEGLNLLIYRRDLYDIGLTKGMLLERYEKELTRELTTLEQNKNQFAQNNPGYHSALLQQKMIEFNDRIDIINEIMKELQEYRKQITQVSSPTIKKNQ